MEGNKKDFQLTFFPEDWKIPQPNSLHNAPSLLKSIKIITKLFYFKIATKFLFDSKSCANANKTRKTGVF
jgi:hypothetical protein